MGSRGDPALASGDPRPPFAGEPRVVVVLPQRDPTLGGSAALLELERGEFEAELGAPVEFASEDPGAGARWLLELTDADEGPPTTTLDREERLVVSRAGDVDGLFEAVNVWRTVARAGGGTVTASDCGTLDEAVERVVVEVADTYPAFELRRLDWQAICAQHLPRVRGEGGSIASFQRWLAELEDGHTWVREPVAHLPYAVRVTGAATLERVPAGTVAGRAGVRPGWRVVAIDDDPVDVADWVARTGAPPHARPLIAGRRLLAGPPGIERAYTAESPDGGRSTWREAPAPVPAGPLVTWRALSPDAGYVRVEVWVEGRGIDDALDAALTELRGRERLVLDLRGNPGGNLVLACRARDRFLRQRTALGTIRYSVGEGGLSGPFPLVGEPAEPERRWPGRLVVLTDPLTFSASEDFLLGLQGLEHVYVVGRRSGGGSGRPRALRLLPGSWLTVSTALTFDRDGRCVEGAGIPVDLALAGADEQVLAAAARS